MQQTCRMGMEKIRKFLKIPTAALPAAIFGARRKKIAFREKKTAFRERSTKRSMDGSVLLSGFCCEGLRPAASYCTILMVACSIVSKVVIDLALA